MMRIDKRRKTKTNRKAYFSQNYQYYIMLSIPIIYFVVFKYIPLYGIIIAFKDYSVFSTVWDSPWVGLDVFREIFAMKDFANALRNTLMLSCLNIIVCGSRWNICLLSNSKY